MRRSLRLRASASLPAVGSTRASSPASALGRGTSGGGSDSSSSVRHSRVAGVGGVGRGIVQGGDFGEDLAAVVARVGYLSPVVGGMASRFMVADVARGLGGGTDLEVVISPLLGGDVPLLGGGVAIAGGVSDRPFLALDRYHECVAHMVSVYTLADVEAFVSGLRSGSG